MFLRVRNSWRLHRHFRKTKREERKRRADVIELFPIPFSPPKDAA